MSLLRRKATRPQRLRAKLLAIVVILASLGAGIAGARVTYGLWDQSASINAGIVTAGDLDMSIDSVGWTAPDGTSGTLNELATSVFPPGAQVSLRIDISAVTSGDNMAVLLGATVIGGQTQTQTWHVEEGGAQISPLAGDAAIDVSLSVPAPAASSRAWTVVVEMTMPIGSWVDPTTVSTTTVDLGTVTLSAHQVRCGDDFAAQCA